MVGYFSGPIVESTLFALLYKLERQVIRMTAVLHRPDRTCVKKGYPQGYEPSRAAPSIMIKATRGTSLGA